MKAIKSLALLVLVACGGGGTSSGGGDWIQGDAQFRARVQEALVILPPVDFTYVRRWTVAIVQDSRSGAGHGGRTLLAERELRESTEWLAGVLVHEACHHEQIVLSQPIVEGPCNKKMRETLQRVGASERERTHLEPFANQCVTE